MSVHSAFRRQPVPGQYAQNLKTITLPAPTRGIINSENEAFMQPGGAIVQDNWASTMRGLKLRGGCIRWADLHDDDEGGAPPVPSTARLPVISAFQYVTATDDLMFVANRNTLYDATASYGQVIVKTGNGSGNWVASQFANAAAEWMLALNDAGDFPLRFDGTSWVTLDPSAGAPSDGALAITGPVGTAIENGRNLVYVWKYQSRYFFIEANSMNAWYLDIDEVGGLLSLIPLSGAATKGGKLLFGAVWSIDAGDGTDDKCVFVTDQGEVLIFSGSNPSDASNWKQEGRYQLSPPLGMNAHLNVGGDLLIATIDGIVPLTQVINKSAGQLELAMITYNIKGTWREEVINRGLQPWTMFNWNEYGALFVTWPGSGKRCGVVNNATGAWCRFVGWAATCFVRRGESMFFGTKDGLIMQADRTGYDDGVPYIAILVGGWETFKSPSNEVVWHQARAAFLSKKPTFNPQLDATINYQVVIPPAPPVVPDATADDVWDEGLWDTALWDAEASQRQPVHTTMWVSVGKTGFSHAPTVQATVAQLARPVVELIALSITYESAGVNV